jgi:hypothetical protein
VKSEASQLLKPAHFLIYLAEEKACQIHPWTLDLVLMTPIEIANLELVARLQAGDESAREEMIKENIPLVKTVAGSFVWEGPDPPPDFEELFSYGLEGLWRASRRVHDIKHEKVGRNLRCWIHGEMARRAKQNHPLHKLNRKRKGQKPRRLEPYEPKDGPVPGGQEVVDCWDSILAACDDDIDRQIVELRRGNASYSLIAETLNLKSKSTVSDRLRKIRKRMDFTERPHRITS